MKNRTTILFIILLMQMTSSCSKFNKDVLIGQYAGELYQPNSMGAHIILSLQKDDLFAVTSQIYDSDGTSSTQWGTWRYLENKVVELTLPSGVFRLDLDSSGKLSLLNQEDSIVLQRDTPLSILNFEGRYFLSPISGENNEFTQYVEIRSDNQERPNVRFVSSDANGETIFSARGYIINNQIEISLSEMNKDMNSTMVIRFVENNLLEVSTADFDNRYDLNYVCRGGGSLAGEYIKQK